MCLPQDVFFLAFWKALKTWKLGPQAIVSLISSSGSRGFRVQDFGGPGLRA